MLTDWRAAQAKLAPMLDDAPALAEAKPFVEDWRNLSAIGLGAAEYLEKGELPPADWRDAKLKILAEIGKPKAALEFAVLPGIKFLVVAASEMPNLKNLHRRKGANALKTLLFRNRRRKIK